MLYIIIIFIIVIAIVLYTQKTGNHEFQPNRNQKTRTRKPKIVNLAAATFENFLGKVKNFPTRLICIVGMPFCGVSHLSKMIHKKLSFKIADKSLDVPKQRAEFRGKKDKYIIENCPATELPRMFKGETNDRNMVLIFIHPSTFEDVGRMMRKVKNEYSARKASMSKEEKQKYMDFIDKYGPITKRKKFIEDSKKLLDQYSKNYIVYLLKNKFKD